MRRIKRLLLATPLAVLAIVGTSCDGSGDGLPDCDYLITAGWQSGAAVPIGIGTSCPDALRMQLSATVNRIATGTAGGGPPPGTTAQDFFRLFGYTVTYQDLRTGGTTPGLDVPQPFSQSFPFEPERVPAIFDISNFEVLVPAQFNQPPLNSSSYFPAAGGGVPLRAYITVFGAPVTDANQDCSDTFTFDFAVDQSANCP